MTKVIQSQLVAWKIKIKNLYFTTAWLASFYGCSHFHHSHAALKIRALKVASYRQKAGTKDSVGIKDLTCDCCVHDGFVTHTIASISEQCQITICYDLCYGMNNALH